MELGENNVVSESVNQHYKEPGNGLFDDVTPLVLKALVSNGSESDVKGNVGK